MFDIFRKIYLNSIIYDKKISKKFNQNLEFKPSPHLLTSIVIKLIINTILKVGILILHQKELFRGYLIPPLLMITVITIIKKILITSYRSKLYIF